MCWEDVKINRRQYVSGRWDVPADGVTTTGLPANIYRQRLIIVPKNVTTITANLITTIYATPAGNDTILDQKLYYQHQIFDIKDLGMDLQKELQILVFDVNTAYSDCVIIEYSLNDPEGKGTV